jgi:hypothetical protein
MVGEAKEPEKICAIAADRKRRFTPDYGPDLLGGNWRGFGDERGHAGSPACMLGRRGSDGRRSTGQGDFGR